MRHHCIQAPCPQHGGAPLDLDDYEIALSSGGAAATLAGVGTMLACHIAGITKWRRISGISGGSIVASLRAVGLDASNLLHVALETDFSRLIDWKKGLFGVPGKLLARAFNCADSSAELPRDWAEKPWTGLLGTQGIGEVIRQMAKRCGLGDKWPANFQTMATTKNGSQVLFTADGIYLFGLNGEKEVLSDEPAPLHLAVRASATIPGIMAALSYKGITLFDGAMSRDGLCPVGVQIRNFAADPRKIIACRVGEDSLKPIMGRCHRLARFIWRVHPHTHWGAETAGVIEIRPPLDHVHTLKFSLSRDEKWLAILLSCDESLSRLAMDGILHGERLCFAQSLIQSLGFFRDAQPAGPHQLQTIALRAESVFGRHGLY